MGRRIGLAVLSVWFGSAAAQELNVRLESQNGQGGPITAVAYAPGEKQVLSGDDRFAIVWDAMTRRQIYRVPVPISRSFAVSKDGVLTVGAQQGRGASFEYASGRPRESAYRVAAICGGTLAHTQEGTDHSAIRDLSTGGVLLELPFATSGVMTWNARFACAADRKRVLVAGPGNLQNWQAQLWDLETKQRIGTFGDEGPVISVMALSPDGAKVLTVSGTEAVIHVWDVRSGRESGRLTGHADIQAVMAGALNRQLGPSLAGLYDDPASVLPRINALEFSADGTKLATAGHDGVFVWDVAAGRILAHLQKGMPAQSLAFSSDGRRLLVGTGQKVLEYDWAADKQLAVYEGQLDTNTVSHISPDGRFLFQCYDSESESVLRDSSLLAMTKSLLYWDLSKGHSGIWPSGMLLPTALAFSRDSKLLAVGDLTGEIRLWDLAGSQALRTWPRPAKAPMVSALAFAPDGKSLAAAWGDGSWAQLDLAGGERRFGGKETGSIYDLAFSNDGAQLVLGLSAANSGMTTHLLGSQTLFAPNGSLKIFDLKKNSLDQEQKGKVHLRQAMVFTPDGRLLLIGEGVSVGVFDLQKGYKVRQIAQDGIVARVAVSGDGRRMAAATLSGTLELWDLTTGRSFWKRSGIGQSGITSLEFFPGGERIVAGLWDGGTVFLDAAQGREMLRISRTGGIANGWYAVTPDGRFDASSLEVEPPLHWIASDAPMTPLPLDVFLRQYYEPRLIMRTLNGERFPPLRNLAGINRLRPRVDFGEIVPDGDSPGSVSVKVLVREERDPGSGRHGGVHSVRLFRDGRLVGVREFGGSLAGSNEVPVLAEFPHIRLRRASSTVRFTAYAFNADMVKSDTASAVHRRKGTSTTGSAWVVAIGVNRSAAPQLDLKFAASDARQLAAQVAGALRKNTLYSKVVPVVQISDDSQPTGATKAAIKATLSQLAGEADPEDLVIVSYSGHGYADSNGRFYLIPSDAGKGWKPGRDPLARLLEESISSDDLSDWMRDIDAQIVFIVDACQSASAVEGGGFKPGPMGSRGLGQLAYDKGMLFLAATQSGNVALESGKVQQGLLTYALVREGLEAGKADWSPADGSIRLGEWLEYAVKRVPELWDEIVSGKREPGGARLLVQPGSDVRRVADADARQEPALFNYTGAANYLLWPSKKIGYGIAGSQDHRGRDHTRSYDRVTNSSL